VGLFIFNFINKAFYMAFRDSLSSTGKVKALVAGVEGTALELEHEGIEDGGSVLVVGTT
jgi:hypothetical protein